MPQPEARSPPITANSRSASSPVSAAVGSSMTNIRAGAPSPLASVLAILTSIWSPVVRRGAADRLDDPGEDLDQRRFARAVFAHQGMHLAASEVEGGVNQRRHAGIGLGGVGDGEEGHGARW